MSQQPPPYGPGSGQGGGLPQGARMQMGGQQGGQMAGQPGVGNRGMMNQGQAPSNFMGGRMVQQAGGRMPMQQANQGKQHQKISSTVRS